MDQLERTIGVLSNISVLSVIIGLGILGFLAIDVLLALRQSKRKGDRPMANVWDERRKGREEEYFQRKEQEALEKVRRRLAAEEHEYNNTPSSHRCPKCNEDLQEIVFQGVLVDRCIGCHGVWFDRDELERITVRESRGWLSHFWRRTTPSREGARR